MDRIEAMSTLLAVVEAGSLSAASRQLGVPLATVSRRITDLEAHLKAQLLNRSSRRITLTDAAQSYVRACRHILDQVDEAERTVSGEYSVPKGELTITAPLALGRVHVVPVATAFLKAYPDILLRVQLSDRVLSLQQEDIDAGVRIGTLPDSSLVARRVGSARRVVCASPEYLAARGTPRTPGDLLTHSCIAFTSFVQATSWDFSVDGSVSEIPVQSRLFMDSAEAVVDATLAGGGITRLFSYHVAEAVKAGRLSILLESFEPAPLPVNIVHRGGGLLPLKVRAFLEFSAPKLKARLAEDLS